MTLLSRCHKALKAFGTESRRDDGVIGLVIALALIAAALAVIASTVRQNKDAEIRRLSANSTSVKLLKNSIVSFFLTNPGAGINGRIPCPDTNFPPDGSENGTTACTATTGVVPWLTLGLSETDVIDAYGNYYTYAVSGTVASRQVCTSVTNSYASSIVEYTGTLNEVIDTEVRLSSQSAGQGAPYYYAFISHGENGLGAIASTGTRRNAPSSSSEIQNCPSQNINCTDPSSLTLFSGPRDETNSTYFDDTVFVGSTSQLTEMCESLTPGGKAGADLSEEFTQTSIGSLPARLAAVSGTANVQQSTVTGNTTDRVLRATGANAAVRTASLAFNTAERARYVSFEWRPTTLGTNNTAGISVGLRATAGDRGASTTVGAFTADLFNANSLDGITVRFFEDAADNANGSTLNRIYICNQAATTCATGDAAVLASSGSDTFTITTTNNPVYTVETYDDGVQIWARITQVNDTTNTATVSVTSITTAQQDLSNANAIVAVNYSNATVEIDDIAVGRGTMGVTFDGTDDIITAGDNFDTTSGDLTLEAWIRPDSLPTGNNQAVLMSKWTQGAANSTQGYRLYLTSGGALSMQVAGDDGANIVTETTTFGGYNATAGRWDHIAVTYNAAEQAYKLYLNRDLITRKSSTAFGTNGINQGASATFAVGAELNSSSAAVNGFDGDLADVRVWSTTRTAQQVFANYNRRLQLTSGLSGLLVNWTLDRDTTLNTGDSLPTFGTTAAVETAAVASATNGALTNGASYIGIQQRYIPAFASTSFCSAGGAQGAVVGAFQCDYRLTAQSGTVSIPNNLPSIFVRAWGGGGGGYDFGSFDSSGGGGGFAGAKFFRIGTNSIANQTFNIDVGGGAAASAGANNGAGGGGASGLWLDSMTDVAGIVAGGGGGAAYGDDNFTTQRTGYNCDLAGECGPGGGGGGPQNILTGVSGAQAPDAGAGATVTTNICGGRGGDDTYGDFPPDPAPGGGGTNTCDNGGADPTSPRGASGGGANDGGDSGIGTLGSTARGGAGYDGSGSQVGGGGGGGGVSNSAITSGGAEAGGYDGGGATNNGSDTNRSGFGGGGGAGFADNTSLVNDGFIGAAGAAPAAGGASDAAYEGSIERVVSGTFTTTKYCAASGTPCTDTPGRGGEPNVNAAGRPGAVVLKW